MENEQPQIEVQKSNNNKNILTLPMSVLIAAILISGALVYNRSGVPSIKGKAVEDTTRKEVLSDDDSYLGNIDAPVKIIEFSDFQCPYCRRFWKETLPLIKSKYVETGKAVLVYRDFPLGSHPAAQISAQAAECADDQGKFWEFHDKIFSEQDKQGSGTIQYGLVELKKWARDIGLNQIQFNQCLDTQKYKDEVEKDFSDAVTAEVSGTPTTFINGRPVIGAQPFSAFERIIEEELSSTQKKRNSFFK